MDTLPYLGGGALAVLVVVIGYLLRILAADRHECHRTIAELRQRYDAEVMARRGIQERIDIERERRRHAEDIAYQLARARGQPTVDDAAD